MGDIEKTYLLDFPVDRVFDAWTSSETVIAPAKKMHVEPHVGGAYMLFMSEALPDDKPSNCGTFSVFEKNKRVVYSWEWNKDGEVTQIAVDFSAQGDKTLINLRHTGFIKQESRDMHDSGWDSYIEGFTEHLVAKQK